MPTSRLMLFVLCGLFVLNVYILFDFVFQISNDTMDDASLAINDIIYARDNNRVYIPDTETNYKITIPIVNTSSDIVSIKSISKSCSCQQVSINVNEIPPSDRAEICSIVDVKGKRGLVELIVVIYFTSGGVQYEKPINFYVYICHNMIIGNSALYIHPKLPARLIIPVKGATVLLGERPKVHCNSKIIECLANVDSVSINYTPIEQISDEHRIIVQIYVNDFAYEFMIIIHALNGPVYPYQATLKSSTLYL